MSAPLLTFAGNGFSLLASAIKATLAFAFSLRGARLSQLSRLTALVVALDDAILIQVERLKLLRLGTQVMNRQAR